MRHLICHQAALLTVSSRKDRTVYFEWQSQRNKNKSTNLLFWLCLKHLIYDPNNYHWFEYFVNPKGIHIAYLQTCSWQSNISKSLNLINSPTLFWRKEMRKFRFFQKGLSTFSHHETQNNSIFDAKFAFLHFCIEFEIRKLNVEAYQSDTDCLLHINEWFIIGWSQKALYKLGKCKG